MRFRQARAVPLGGVQISPSEVMLWSRKNRESLLSLSLPPFIRGDSAFGR